MTKALLRALAGERVDPPPVWLMRQAGRYLPEYRATREKAGSFLDLCYTPELAAEVTLQPIRRFGFDAAILFADILLIPQALGLDLRFEVGEGPRLSPITDTAGLRPADEIDATLAPVYETVRILRQELPAEVPLIGFAGAPWTVATYMIAGQGTPDQAPARRLAYADPEAFWRILDRIVDATVHYLAAQAAAGAEALMLFDSWAGAVPGPLYEVAVLRPTRHIVERLRAHTSVPIVGFPRGATAQSRFVADTGVDGLALDTTVPLPEAAALQRAVCVQGNLDPLHMVTGGSGLDHAVDAIREALAHGPHIFNLGHGITPDADPANVERLLRRLKG